MKVVRDQACRRDVSEGTVAVSCGLSPRTVSRAIHTTGMSLRQHVNHVRVERAKDLLGSTTLPIKVIALDLGFRWPQDFSRTFADLAGTSPSGFRSARRARS